MVASHKYVHSIVQIDNQFFVLIIKRPSVCLVPNESIKKTLNSNCSKVLSSFIFARFHDNSRLAKPLP